MSDAMMAYAAGIFDGEGSVVVRKRTYDNAFMLHVNMTSTSFALISWMKEKFGGSVGTMPADFRVKRARQAWWWATCSLKANQFIEKLLPFLHLKKEQAKHALEFGKTIKPLGYNAPLTSVEIAAREDIRRRLSEMKAVITDQNEGFSNFSSDEIYAYVAGLLDGEGTILIYKSTGSYHLRVGIANTDLPALERLKVMFGGSVSEKEKRERSCYDWAVQGQRASDLLRNLLPYLIVKKEQALLAVHFQENRQDVNGELFKQEISDLNRGFFEDDEEDKYELFQQGFE